MSTAERNSNDDNGYDPYNYIPYTGAFETTLAGRLKFYSQDETALKFRIDPPVNTLIDISDDFTVHCYRSKPFNWFQCRMIHVFFGWEIRNV